MSRWAPASSEAVRQLRRLPPLGFLLHQIPDDDSEGPWALHYTRQLQCVLEGVYVHSDFQAWAYRTSLAAVDPEHPWIHGPATTLWSGGGDVEHVIAALLALAPPRTPTQPAWSAATTSLPAPDHLDAPTWPGAHHTPG